MVRRELSVIPSQLSGQLDVRQSPWKFTGKNVIRSYGSPIVNQVGIVIGSAQSDSKARQVTT